MAMLLAACSTPSANERYLTDRDFRRGQMVAELVNPANDYSRARLAHYGTDWDDLPLWNPTAIDTDISPDDPEALRELGERAFFAYPAQLWQLHAGDHLVRIDTKAGPRTAATCATCHSYRGVPGLANAELDVGFGLGRVDVTTPDGHEPLRIPDLRPVRWERYLQASAGVRQRDVIALAIRIETLILTSHHETVRPPPILTLALATYLWSLAPPPVEPAADSRGAALFAHGCAGCHASGEPVAVARVGSDPAAALSRDRGTGTYRPPSLRGVRDRALLLHDGSIHSLDELLDPARTTPGHHFGTALSTNERADLTAYLATL
jgi:mono/diheme cytochrome c family protein